MVLVGLGPGVRVTVGGRETASVVTEGRIGLLVAVRTISREDVAGLSAGNAALQDESTIKAIRQMIKEIAYPIEQGRF